jgi:hypothetical protein
MSSKLHDEHFQPVLEVVARLINLKQNARSAPPLPLRATVLDISLSMIRAVLPIID